uniref:Uncharacterized protein n=1 Tax=candidate division CPR3 bacterium TaxID=2268181 RepID=A0A7C4R5W5_UNCC3
MINKNPARSNLAKELANIAFSSLFTYNNHTARSNLAKKSIMNPEKIQQKETREMFTLEDVNKIAEYIIKNNFQRIYVSGFIGSGKSTFSDSLTSKIKYKNIDLDQYSEIFRQETGRRAESQKEILDFALEKNTPPFVINHADILRQDLSNNADLIVFLNPKNEELLKTREMRISGGAEGDWKKINPEDYKKITEENANIFNDLNGEIIYSNSNSGTIVKKLSD